jgi:hypothetical protein
VEVSEFAASAAAFCSKLSGKITSKTVTQTETEMIIFVQHRKRFIFRTFEEMDIRDIPYLR